MIPQKTKVYLIGAGPGDPELITLKAIKYLRQADVILTDRLVSDAIINEHAGENATIIYVGKDGCSKKNSVAQVDTNDLIVQYALQNKIVVRLKGGDVAFFSNVLDELIVLQSHNIPYEIVPGITAASGASAYAGMPLTARGYSRGVRFITYAKQDALDERYWKELAETRDTLVFYMAGQNWDRLAAHFIDHHVSSRKKMAIIEQATTPYQKVFVYDFNDIKNKQIKRTFVSPSLIIVGDVVNLHTRFAWKNVSDLDENYFKSSNAKSFEVNKSQLQTA